MGDLFGTMIHTFLETAIYWCAGLSVFLCNLFASSYSSVFNAIKLSNSRFAFCVRTGFSHELTKIKGGHL